MSDDEEVDDHEVEVGRDTMTPEVAAQLAQGQLDPGRVEKRSRGVFSHHDRLHLWGLKDYSQPQGKSNARRRIRNRVENAILDLRLLSLLGEGEGPKIVNSLDPQDVRKGAAEFLALLYEGLDGDPAALEPIIEDGVRAVESRQKTSGPSQGGVQSVHTDIDVTYGPDVDDIEHRFREQGVGELTPAEIGVLARSGRLDLDDLENIKAPQFPEYDGEE